MSIKEILETYRTIAAVGLSSHTWRPSYSVSQYMQSAGYRIIAVLQGRSVTAQNWSRLHER